MSGLIHTRSNNNHDERHMYKLVLIADNVKAPLLEFDAHILFAKRHASKGSVRVDHGRAGLAVLREARRMTSDHRGGQDNANGGIPEAAG